jgi:branched-chain amino acid transport system substrate-binding protein
LAPETGLLASLLDSLRVPAEIAIDEINAAGGVNGQPVSYTRGDEGADGTTARATVTSFVNGGVDAIVGPASPATALDVLGIVRTAHVMMCSGSDTLAPVTARSTDGLYFRTAPGPNLQGRALAKLVRADGHRRVAVLRAKGYFGNTLVQGLRAQGARVVADVSYNPANADVDAKVRLALRGKPQAIVVVGFDDDAAAIVAGLIARGAGPDEVSIYGPDTLQSLGFVAAVDASDPTAVAGITGTAPAIAPPPGDPASPFLGVLTNQAIDPVFSAHVYDCTILIALAAVKAESDDPDEMKVAFAKNLRGKTDCNTFATCSALLERGRSIHWRGASSRFDHFDGLAPGDAVYDVWAYDDLGHLIPGEPATVSVP